MLQIFASFFNNANNTSVRKRDTFPQNVPVTIIVKNPGCIHEGQSLKHGAKFTCEDKGQKCCNKCSCICYNGLVVRTNCNQSVCTIDQCPDQPYGNYLLIKY
jgi:hypothetical protein